MVSEAFATKGHPTLTVQAWLRADEPDAKARVMIEGNLAGQPFVRWSELDVQPEWAARAIRAADLPPGRP